MIAIPVKTNKENPAVSTLFGKAKWFAFVDKNNITIEKNDFQSGKSIVEHLVSKGVKKLIFNHMGRNPFMLLQKMNIECYYSGKERVLLLDVLDKLQNDYLVNVNENNMVKYIKQSHTNNN